MLKYIVERQMVYDFYKRSPFDIVGTFDSFYDALEALKKEAYLYSNDKNVVIVISRYKSYGDCDITKTMTRDILIGFYGIDAIKYLNIDSKGTNKNKYGLIVVWGEILTNERKVVKKYD